MSQISFNSPFAEQVGFFRRKLALPSERWDDIERSAHDRGFIVAGAMKADLVADLQAAVGQAIAEGKSIEWFRDHFDQVVAKHGWSGWTGEGSPGGYAWRTRVIYQTNMATSYAAGRWAQLNDPALVSRRPYWKYHHADGVLHPRPLHVAWNGLVLPREHPFWKTHFPPNGWGCHCTVSAAPADDYEKAQAAGRAEPPEGWARLLEKTGAPVGIDRGFNYPPGAGADTPLRELVADKLITYPPAISTALSRDVNRYINAEAPVIDFVKASLAGKSEAAPLWLGFVENPEAVAAATGEDVRGYLVLLPDSAPRHAAASHGYDGGAQRAPEPADYLNVWKVLAEADSLRAGDTSRHGLATVVASKAIDGENFRAVFEIRPGKKNRALALLSFVIKR